MLIKILGTAFLVFCLFSWALYGPEITKAVLPFLPPWLRKRAEQMGEFLIIAAIFSILILCWIWMFVVAWKDSY